MARVALLAGLMAGLAGLERQRHARAGTPRSSMGRPLLIVSATARMAGLSPKPSPSVTAEPDITSIYVITHCAILSCRRIALRNDKTRLRRPAGFPNHSPDRADGDSLDRPTKSHSPAYPEQEIAKGNGTNIRGTFRTLVRLWQRKSVANGCHNRP